MRRNLCAAWGELDGTAKFKCIRYIQALQTAVGVLEEKTGFQFGGIRKTLQKALLSSKNLNWCTPQDFFDVLDREFHFELDAAATEKSAKCPRYFTPQTDGLASPWTVSEGRAVFCNPPYGREIVKWVRKAYEEAKAGTKIVLLLPARTDTRYFHDYIYDKAQIIFLRGRLRFTDEDGRSYAPAPFPSMVVVYN